MLEKDDYRGAEHVSTLCSGVVRCPTQPRMCRALAFEEQFQWRRVKENEQTRRAGMRCCG